MGLLVLFVLSDVTNCFAIALSAQEQDVTFPITAVANEIQVIVKNFLASFDVAQCCFSARYEKANMSILNRVVSPLFAKIKVIRHVLQTCSPFIDITSVKSEVVLAITTMVCECHDG